jgi:hypothetical protein
MVHPFASIPSLKKKNHSKAEVEDREGPFLLFLSLFPHLTAKLEKNIQVFSYPTISIVIL